MPRPSETQSGLIRWTGRVMGGLVVAFLVMDAGMKLLAVPPVIEAMSHLGFMSTPTLARGLGTLLLACTILYTIPRTRTLGAILLTGYLGGAIVLHIRVGNPLLTHVLFGAYVGALMWAAVLMVDRDARRLLAGVPGLRRHFNRRASQEATPS